MAKRFISEAIKKPGALRAAARRRGLIKGDEKLSKTDLEELLRSPNPTTRRRARFAITLSKLRKKKKD